MVKLLSAVSASVLLSAVTMAQAAAPAEPMQNTNAQSMSTPSADSSQPEQAQAPAATPPDSQQQPSAQAASPTVAGEQNTASVSAPEPKMHHAHMMGRKPADDDRLTTALNVLQANGYTSYQDIKLNGKLVDVLATKDDKQEHVVVTEDGQIQPST